MATTDAASLSAPVVDGRARPSVGRKIKIAGDRLRRSRIDFWGIPHSPHSRSDRFQTVIGLNSDTVRQTTSFIYIWNSLGVEGKAIISR